jgi:NADPH:quinone reductase-like Zn-dependent oxidoreductase
MRYLVPARKDLHKCDRHRPQKSNPDQENLWATTRKELEAAARELFAAVRSKKVRVVIGQKYPLSQAADAHRDLEGRRTTGSTVLVP